MARVRRSPMSDTQPNEVARSRSTTASDDGGVPPHLVYVGILVGLLLVFLGTALLLVLSNALPSYLTICVGFGLVLASFGSRAGGVYAGLSATGAGAMALILFLALMYFAPPATVSYQKRGQIRVAALDKVNDLRIIDDSPLYEYRDRTGGYYHFIIVSRKFHSNRLSVQVDTNDPHHELIEMVAVSKDICDRYLSGGDVDDIINWTLDYDHHTITDGNEVMFSEPNRLPDTLPVKGVQHGAWLGSVTLFPRAFAQSTSPSAGSAQALLSRLTADDTAVRRDAREGLIVLGPAAIGQMMKVFHAAPSNYRIKLGVVYALARMLRSHPEQRQAISQALTDEDFKILVAAASDEDKTVRFQAAEFLYVLQDPRAVAPSLVGARSAPDPDIAYNNLLILRQSGQNLPADRKQQIISVIKGDKASSGVVQLGLLRGW